VVFVVGSLKRKKPRENLSVLPRLELSVAASGREPLYLARIYGSEWQPVNTGSIFTPSGPDVFVKIRRFDAPTVHVERDFPVPRLSEETLEAQANLFGQ